MPIDASIPLGVRPAQFESPVNRMAQILQIRGAQQDQSLKTLQADELRRGITENASLNDAYRGAVGADGSVDRNKLMQTLASGGMGSKIPGVQKQFMEADKAQGDVRKQAAEGYKLFQSTLGAQFNNPQASKESVLGAVSGLVQSGAFDPAIAQKLVATLPDDPQQLRMHLRQVITSQLSPEQMLTAFAPKPEKIDDGQKIGFRDANPNSPTYGQTTGGAPVQKMVTPGEVLTDQRTRAEGAANRGVTVRGQDLSNQRALDHNAIQSGQRTQQGVIELRKEFNALPEVKNFREVLPIIESVQRAPNTPAGDIDLIYGVGKVMDPNSVVREGEMTLVIKSGSPAQRLQGYVNYVHGGGRLGPAQRQELLGIMQSRVQGLKSNYDAARKTYETAADRGGLPREQIFVENAVPAAPPVEFGALPTTPKSGKPSGRGNAYQPPREVNFGDLK